MPLSHLALAVLVVGIWGTNFVVIHVGLARFPPFTFAALRFLLASIPLLWFVPRPRLPLGPVIAYGLLIGVGQFGLMLYALAGHIAPGLASLVIQTQAFFTVAIAAFFAREPIRARAAAALLLCATGIAAVAFRSGGDADLPGILLVLAAAVGWAGGNIVVKRAGAVEMLPLVVWSSLVSAVALLGAALAFEGPSRFMVSIERADGAGWAALAWQSFGNTLFGYGMWNWLLARHPAAQVAPIGLLVPIFGMSASAYMLGEAMPVWKLIAAALVLAGLGINLAPHRAKRDSAPSAAAE
jgi:O-acetylserine/cysteine efflux transporter